MSETSGCLPTFLRLFLGNKRQPSGGRLPYRTRDDFLSPAELSFYHVLQTVVQQKAVILAKVRLADIFFVTRPNENFSYFNRIVQKHIDFLLCDPQTLHPFCGIELDDRSHSQRQDRDEFVDDVFDAADLPLVRVPAQRAYSTTQLVEQFAPYLTLEAPGPVTKQVANGAPTCPKCGAVMVLRTAKNGQYKGQQFYACPNYPACRQISRLSAEKTVL